MASALHGADEETLAAALAGLANPVRLRLVRLLLAPTPLGEIEVRAADPSAPRPLARQTVRSHLDRLLDAGLVVARPSADDGRSPTTYVANPQVLFALAEDLRALAQLRPAVEPVAPTATAPPSARAREAGPRLVLAKGVDEGRSFQLHAPRRSVEAVWTIGRRRDADVPLDFDPFVSAENSRVLRREAGFLLEDVAASRNGTLLNFEPLPRGGRAALRHGDLVGVGRSVLVFREA